MLGKIVGSVVFAFVLFFGITSESRACPNVVYSVVPNQVFVNSNFQGFNTFGNPFFASTNFTPITVATGNTVTTFFTPNNSVFLPGNVIVNRGNFIFTGGRVFRVR